MSVENDWWKGTGDDDRFALRMEVEHAGMGDPQPERWDRLMVGVAAYHAMNAIKMRPEECGALISQMIADVELNIRLETKKLLQETDIATPEARDAHFKARVAHAVIALLNDYLVQGAEARDQINHPEEAMP